MNLKLIRKGSFAQFPFGDPGGPEGLERGFRRPDGYRGQCTNPVRTAHEVKKVF